MRSTHSILFRTLSLGIGLALLVVTGTAAMIGVFSSPLPAHDLYRPVAIAPLHEVAQQPMGSDTLLYERVAGSDGSHQWVMTEEPSTNLAQRSNTDTSEGLTSVVDASGFQNVSYTLLAKPTGLSKTIKNCSRVSTGARSKTYDAYDISCKTLG